MKMHMVCCWLLLGLVGAVASEPVPLFRNPQAPLEERVGDLLQRLTLEEKVALCHGAFLSGRVPRLGIGQLAMLDGRQGLRPVAEQRGTRTTSLPAVLTLSCTWDEVAARDFGRLLAREMLAMDRHVLLAPMLNVGRSPLGGRNFENFGEDPFLVGTLGAAYVQGVQEAGVGACAGIKHQKARRRTTCGQFMPHDTTPLARHLNRASQVSVWGTLSSTRPRTA